MITGEAAGFPPSAQWREVLVAKIADGIASRRSVQLKLIVVVVVVVPARLTCLRLHTITSSLTATRIFQQKAHVSGEQHTVIRHSHRSNKPLHSADPQMPTFPSARTVLGTPPPALCRGPFATTDQTAIADVR